MSNIIYHYFANTPKKSSQTKSALSNLSQLTVSICSISLAQNLEISKALKGTMSKDCAPLFNDSNPLGPHFILKHIKGFSNRVYISYVQKLRGVIDKA